MYHLLLFYANNGYAYTPQCYVDTHIACLVFTVLKACKCECLCSLITKKYITAYQSTRLHQTEDHTVDSHPLGNLKYHTILK